MTTEGAGPAHQPGVVIVELTNDCNLRCPFCTTAMAMTRPRGYMRLELFRSLISDITATEWRPLISMNMCGEPLLHEQVDRFVGVASANGLSTFISTNATRLTPQRAERLLDAGLSHIALCVDGATKRSHEAYRIGSDFAQVRASCEAMLAARNRRNSTTTRITIQTLLTALSERELADVLHWAWQHGADEVFFKTLSLGSRTSDRRRQAGTKLLPANPELRRRPRAETTVCRAPLEHTIIYYDGRLGVCCVDFDNLAGLPSIENEGLRRTLQLPAVATARAEGCRREHGLCRQCRSSTNAFRGFHIPLTGYTAGCPNWHGVIEDELRKCRTDSADGDRNGPGERQGMG